MTKKRVSLKSLILLCFSALLPVEVSAQQRSIEELFVEAECQVKEGIHSSHDFRKSEMVSGGIDGSYKGPAKLKIGFKHTSNDKGGFESSIIYNWDKSPINGVEQSRTHIDPLSSSVVLTADYLSYITHSEVVQLMRTYRNEWHGTLISLNFTDNRSSAFVYPLKCNFNNTIDGPLALLKFKYDKIPEKLGLNKE